MLTVIINLALALNVLFGNSMVSLVLLYTIFVVSVAAGLNIVYMTVNDNRHKHYTVEMDYEEVDSEQVLAVIKWIFAESLLIQDQVVLLVSMSDPVSTIIAFLILHLIVLWVWLFDVSILALIWALHLCVVLKPYYSPKANKIATAVCLKFGLLPDLKED